MRLNIYAEEMTDRIEIITKTVEGTEFTALRFYLELPAAFTPDGMGGLRPATKEDRGELIHHRAPFIHRHGDDDSSAVTFWGKQDMRKMLRKALDLLDAHYAQRDADRVKELKPYTLTSQMVLRREGSDLVVCIYARIDKKPNNVDYFEMAVLDFIKGDFDDVTDFSLILKDRRLSVVERKTGREAVLLDGVVHTTGAPICYAITLPGDRSSPIRTRVNGVEES